MNNFINSVVTVWIPLLATFAFFSTAGTLIWSKVRPTVKSVQLQKLGDWALSAVQYAESTVSGGEKQKAAATAFIKNILDKHNLSSLVSAEEIDAVIELELKRFKELNNKANTTPIDGEVVATTATTSNDPLSESESTTEVI